MPFQPIFRLVLIIGLVQFTIFNCISQIATEQKLNIIESNDVPFWAAKMYNEQADIERVETLYLEYYKTHPFIKNEHTQYFKRWLKAIRSDLTGKMNPNLSNIDKKTIGKHQSAYVNRRESNADRSLTSWTGIGPYDWDHTAASRSYAPGAAHVYCVKAAASNPDILYAGTATAGIWKSDDKGMNWMPLTYHLAINRVYALAINPLDPQDVFADLFDNIYRSLDGGNTWLPTGDVNFQNLDLTVYDIVIQENTGVLFAATDEGLFRSANSGANWTEVITNKTMEVEFHPTNDNVIYAVEQIGEITQFKKSTNAGLSFTTITNGWPSPSGTDHNRRAEIAVSAAAPNKVFALLTGSVNGGSGLYGIYTSIDQGNNWTFKCCGPQAGGLPDLTTTPPNINIMAWQDNGSDNGGQYYYDVAFDVSPTNADSMMTGGVNMWISADGGSSFVCPSKWSHPEKADYVHADIHDINYYDNGEIWLACDGGIFYSNDGGVNFDRRINGIHGTDFWGFGASFWEPDVMLGGAYHNGTLLKNGDVYTGGWICTDGGDGTGGFVNVGNSKEVYSDANIKILSEDRTVPISTRSYALKPYTHYVVGRTSKMTFHPNNYAIQYFGNGECLYVTKNNQQSVDTLHCFGEAVADIEISLVNPDHIYLSTFESHWGEKRLYKSTDAGLNWSDITPNTTYFNSNRWLPFDITLSDTDVNVVYIARVANSVASYDGQKIYKSVNGGSSWQNLTTPVLDGEQLTNILLQRGTDEGLWIGTRRTVYYKNAGMADWLAYDNNLPLNTFSTKMLINYKTGVIRNATNRSIYEAPLFEISAPKVEISVDKTFSACVRDTFYFSDYSCLSDDNVSWTWTFPGAAWVDSINGRQPKVVYANSGEFDVELTIADAHGSDAMFVQDFIEIIPGCDVDTFPGKSLLTEQNGDYLLTDAFGFSSINFTVAAWVKPNGIQPIYSSIIMTRDGNQAGLNFKNNNVLGYHWPGGQYWWNSNLEVPEGEWSHVALVASSNNIKVYLNGHFDEHVIPIDTALFNEFTIASYRGWNSRNYKGEMDELSIWNRSLSTTEIRELMHLTRDKNNDVTDQMYDPNLLANYQFNELEGNIVYSKVGTKHGSLIGNASRTKSTAPVGTGFSSTKTIDVVGDYLFAAEQLKMTINEPNNLANGDVVVSYIHWPPHDSAMYNQASLGYWTVHGFGANDSWKPEILNFYDPSNQNNNCFDNFLFDRYFNDDAGWNFPVSATLCTDGIAYEIDSFTHPAQFVIGHYDGNYYVDKNSLGGNGKNWNFSFNKLQSALSLAAENDTVFVAEGIYSPIKYDVDCINCSDEKYKTFIPNSGVTVLGGFPQKGGDLLSRNWQNNPTVLSGLLPAPASESVYHVVKIDSNKMNITFDGFRIKDGLANGITSNTNKGAALLNYGGLNLKNIEITNNEAAESIVFNSGISANLIFNSVTVQGNVTIDSTVLYSTTGAELLIDSTSLIEN